MVRESLWQGLNRQQTIDYGVNQSEEHKKPRKGLAKQREILPKALSSKKSGVAALQAVNHSGRIAPLQFEL